MKNFLKPLLLPICALAATAVTARAQAPVPSPVSASSSLASAPTPGAANNNTTAPLPPPPTPSVPADGGTTPAPSKAVWSEVRVNGPYIAMTFDDGPSAALTPGLLDLLKQKGVHVTFFVLGSLAKDHPEILRRAVAEGHEIANHSWDHPNLGKMPDESVSSQLNRTKDIITAATGKPCDLLRPPYGSMTALQRHWFHDQLGYKIILWSVDPLDWKDHNPSLITRRLVDGARPGSIMLAHDIHKTTIEAMPAVLDELLAKGFKFVTVSELLAMELPPDPKKASSSSPSRPPRPSLAPGVPATINGSVEPMPGPTPALPAAAPSPSATPKRN
ncbi:MAG: polysaccharide deacetylase family protein [Verrucomicrobia bacterium]|nr:polysaccharide deacetylase family protein [Verrucomicrobiota bacterium]